MNTKQKGILTILVLMASILVVVIVSVVPWQLVHDGNGGGGEEPPIYNTLPTYPTLYDIQPDPDTDGEITLDWSDSSWVHYYNVYRRKPDLVEEKIIGILSSSFVDQYAKDDGVYSYKIEAVNNIGKVQSNTQDVTVEISTDDDEEEEEEEDPPVPPNEPILYTIASPNTDGEISLEWDVVPDALYYEVYKSIDGGDYNVIYPIIEENYYDDLVFVDGTYSYKIKAINDAGTSGFSNVETVVVFFPIIDPPNEPLLESIVPEVSNDGVVSLSWSSVPNALYYEVYKSYDESSFVLLKTLDENYCDDLVLEDGVYSYKIKAGNDIGTSGFSNVEYVVVYISEPSEPTESIEQTDDYTMLYILLVVLGVLIIPVVILVKRKSKKS